ncbi:MAG: putative anti-sigma regulatory factor, serine/threonine protein kinase [Modestobacter sp.]|nr:putative anti-sigma regulatory factor, serine/threonine protein kinase [Modestobacter sp.]
MVGGRRPGWADRVPGTACGSAIESAPAACVRDHTAAVVGSEAEALAAAVPFLDTGLTAGDLVVLSCPPERGAALRRELGVRAGDVHSDSRVSLLDTRAPDALLAVRRLLERAAASGSGRMRLVGETRFGPAPRDWREGQRFESVVNTLLATERIEALCLYDRQVLPAEVVDSAPATHPSLLVDGVARASPAYQDPADYLAQLPLAREPIEDDEPVFAVDDAPVLAELRHHLAAVLVTVVPDREQREDLHLAVSEIAANAFRHGVRPVSARVWAAADRVVCTVRDRGTCYGDPLAGFQPAHGADLSRGGMGLWLARKLWDHVDLLPGPGGLTVRLSSALD